MLGGNHNPRGEQQVAPRPAAGDEDVLDRMCWGGHSDIESDNAITELLIYSITRFRYTHSSAPFFQIQMYPTTRTARKTIISMKPNMRSALNCTAQGNRKMVSTSNTTNRMATM